MMTLTMRMLAGLAVVAAPLIAQRSAGVEDAVASISETRYRDRIGVLAHDSMRGRATPSPELTLVANWIAEQFGAAGLTPGGADGYLQTYEITRTQYDVVESRGELVGGRPLKLVMGRDFMPYSRLQARIGTFEGDAILVLPAQKDTTDMLTGWDLTGKVLVQYAPQIKQGVRPYILPPWRRELAGVVWIARMNDAIFGQLVQRNNPHTSVGDEGGILPVLAVRERAVRDYFQALGVDLRELHKASKDSTIVMPLPNFTARFKLARRVLSSESAPNVVGIVPGSDPELKDEYIVFSAHMDHIGSVGGARASRCRAADGDNICNGADDNASGASAVMELAQAFARLDPAPRRSMIFLTVSGEERGLFGSTFFTEQPPVPREKIVADINLDMISRNWKDSIAVIGKKFSSLGEVIERVATEHPELGLAAIDDPWPEENLIRRSDQFSFARKGIPVIALTSGLHDDWHKPSDEPETIDVEKAIRVTKLLFYFGLEVANADQAPAWLPPHASQFEPEPDS